MRFLFVDRILEVEPGRRLLATKAITQMDGYLTAHYQRRPSAPATLVVEALAQAGGWLTLISRDFNIKMVLALVEGVKIYRQAQPGDVLSLEVRILFTHADGVTLGGEARVGEELIATVDRILLAHVVDKDGSFRQKQRDYFNYMNGELPHVS